MPRRLPPRALPGPHDLRSPVPRRPSTRRRLRRALRRSRFAVVALCCGLAVAQALTILAPAPPPTVAALVTARDVAAGAVLRAADVRAVRLPTEAVPHGSPRSPDAVVGRTAAVALVPGQVLTDPLVAAGALARSGGDGTVVVPVRLDDPAVATLLGPGDRVDLVAVSADGAAIDVVGDVSTSEPTDRAAPRYLARRALVVALPRTEADTSDGGGVLGTGATPTSTSPELVLVAVPADDAAAIAQVGTTAGVGAVLVP